MCDNVMSVAQHNFIHRYTIIFNNVIMISLLDPPVIDKGSFVLRPSVIARVNKRVKIGTPVYIYDGFYVKIDCNILIGSPPITIQWLRNGSPYRTGQSVSTITITNANNGDVFTCKATNIKGSDIESTIVYVEYGKYICMYVCHMYVRIYVCIIYNNAERDL